MSSRDTTRPTLQLPVMAAGINDVRALFVPGKSYFPKVLCNPHFEPEVAHHTRMEARAAAVMILLTDAPTPSLLLTERSAKLRFAGHQVFPGGIADAGDDEPLTTALRETNEEIGLDAHGIEVLGRMPDYFTHSGYCIAPYVGVIQPEPELCLSPDEVASVNYVPLEYVFQPQNYALQVRSRDPYRANFYMMYESIRITGPTISLIISLYQALAISIRAR